MLTFILFLVASPLLFGIWFAALPSTVPRWVLALPLMFLDFVWKAEERRVAGEDRESDGQILYGAAPERDRLYRLDQVDHQPGLGDATLVNVPNPDRVRALGVAIIAVWMGLAVFVKYKLAH